MATVKSLLVKGEFSEADLQALTALLREIEQRQPTKDFTIAILEADVSLSQQEATDLIKRIFPKIDGNEPAMGKQLMVVCPDGKTRAMITALGNFVPDIEQPKLVMTQGVVDFDGALINGEAWLRDDGKYYFHFRKDSKPQ